MTKESDTNAIADVVGEILPKVMRLMEYYSPFPGEEDEFSHVVFFEGLMDHTYLLLNSLDKDSDASEDEISEDEIMKGFDEKINLWVIESLFNIIVTCVIWITWLRTSRPVSKPKTTEHEQALENAIANLFGFELPDTDTEE